MIATPRDVVEDPTYKTACKKGRLPIASRRISNAEYLGVEEYIEGQTDCFDFHVCDTNINPDTGDYVIFMEQNKLLRLPVKHIVPTVHCACDCGTHYYCPSRVLSISGPPEGYTNVDMVPPAGFYSHGKAKDIYVRTQIIGGVTNTYTYTSSIMWGLYSPEVAAMQSAPNQVCPAHRDTIYWYKYLWTQYTYRHVRGLYTVVENKTTTPGWQNFGLAGWQCLSYSLSQGTPLFFSDANWPTFDKQFSASSVTQYTAYASKPFARTYQWNVSSENYVDSTWTVPGEPACGTPCRC